MPNVIYFVQEGADGPIKIGCTVLPRSRVQNLQVANPRELRLLGLMDGGTEQEDSLHDEFRETRVRGEWYEPTPELLAGIEANTFSLETFERRLSGLTK